jgi:glycine amidinotransferase
MVVEIADGAYFEPTEPGSRPALRDKNIAEMVPFPRCPKKQEVTEKAKVALRDQWVPANPHLDLAIRPKRLWSVEHKQTYPVLIQSRLFLI